jgi:hypothetical protein
LCHQQPPHLGVGQCDNQTILSCRAFSKGARWPLVQLARSASIVVAATMFPGDRQCCSAALPPPIRMRCAPQLVDKTMPNPVPRRVFGQRIFRNTSGSRGLLAKAVSSFS